MKLIRLAFLVIALSAISYAQDELAVVKQVAPDIYPPAARAVRAYGEVNVTVEIDPNGKVTNAKAFRGHPLLRAVSERAAALWEFSATAKDSPVRTTILSFNFNVDGSTRMIDESERSEMVVSDSIFTNAFTVETSYVTLVPRLLLLPRENGVIKAKFCDLHREQMQFETQFVRCGSTESRPPQFVRSEDYNDAEDALFPNANTADIGSCYEMIERAEVTYCSACRIARSNWIQINR